MAVAVAVAVVAEGVEEAIELEPCWLLLLILESMDVEVNFELDSFGFVIEEQRLNDRRKLKKIMLGTKLEPILYK